MSLYRKMTTKKIRPGLYALDGFRLYHAEKTGTRWELFTVRQGELSQHHGAFRTLADAKLRAEAIDEARGSREITRLNLMSGKPYTERADTPVYMSPAHESYWSM